MPRKARCYQISYFYHIMIQGDEKKYIFSQAEQKEKYRYLLNHNAFRNDVKIIAYCIMDNHVHVLVHSKEQERISKMMSQCNTSYGRFFSQKRGEVGHVFRERFKSECIHTKSHLLNCIKYIHLNPVKANIVQKSEEYIYSSYNKYLNQMDNETIDICDISEEEYIDIIKATSVEMRFIDDKIMSEEKEKVLNEINEKYDLQDLSKRDIVEIYLELKKRCDISKTQMAKLINVERKKFAKIIADNLE